MKFLNSGNIVRIPLDEIHVEGRLREVRDAFVENLIVMAEDTGITTPVHVRKVQGRYVLIDGAHRLEASRRMGLSDIAALVVECRADEARAMEASNNLGAARMTPLQTAAFVASWKRDYYSMHPDRKPGVFKGNQHTGKVVEEIISLTTCIADAFGITERQARNILRAGENLAPDEVARLDASASRITMKDLQDIGKIKRAPDRYAVVAALAEGRAKTASAALKALQAPVETPEKSPADEQLSALLKAWDRAGMAALRRFVAERFDTLAPLVVDEAEACDAAEIAELRSRLQKGEAA
ncbi:MAG: ParB N-terminal domain-containing protein [Paracoccus aminovorans]|nr:ParB N-terminal domain-containing protein [Paracoccus aminovorans]